MSGDADPTDAGPARAWHRLGLLAKFSILSLTAILVVAGGVRYSFERSGDAEVHREAVGIAQLVSAPLQTLLGSTGGPAAQPPGPSSGPGPTPVPTSAEIAALSDRRVSRLRVLRSPGTGSLQRQALAGRLASSRRGQTLRVYVPIGTGAVEQVAEVSVRLAPIIKQQEATTRRLWLTVAGALAVLYLILFPSLATASRKLRRTAIMSHHQAHHDELTGLANRRGFADQLGRILEEHRTVAMLAIDVDRFKHVNDRLGHAAGDEVLAAMATRLRSNTTPEAHLARLGGDEFALVCPSRDREEALGLASRLEQAFFKPIELDSGPICVSVSVGVAVVDADTLSEAVSPEAVIAAADAELYARKRARRGVARTAAEVQTPRAVTDASAVSPSRLQ